MKALAKSVINQLGFEVSKKASEGNPIETSEKGEKFPLDFSQEEIDICKQVSPYTMTSKERIFSLVNAVKYVARHKIPGDIVECGVWKGGSMMAIAKTLLNQQDENRTLYLFDTFSGMSEPSEEDRDFSGKDAAELLKISSETDQWIWCNAPLEGVQSVMNQTGYPQEKIRFVQGKVEDTLPHHAPEKIALLRLDTDWYESTKHELIHLFPRLSKNGVIIIDDYGYWEGAKKAVDEYFEEHNIQILLNRIDETGRIALKL
jgi:O-methyltransferase